MEASGKNNTAPGLSGHEIHPNDIYENKEPVELNATTVCRE